MGTYLLFTSLFRVHIYDVNEYGKYHDGFNTGSISFKVRLYDDNPEFHNKLNDFASKFNKMGLTIKQQETATRKPM